MSPRLVKTEAVVEGRVEERWTLVEEDEAPEYDPATPPAVLGTPTVRITAPARVGGSARYTSDVRLAGMLEAAVLRSPHANARVQDLDLEAARAVPGVHCVLAFGEVPDFDGQPVLWETPPFAGAAVAAVAAESGSAAERALAALGARFEVLEFVTSLETGLEKQQFVEDPSEMLRGDPDTALAAAEIVVEAEYRSPAQVHHALESHCAVADWRPGELTVWSSTQGIYQARKQLSSAFGLEPGRVRVLCEYMGGAFGSKFGCGPEGFIATALSRAAGRPVRLVLSRRDEATVTGFRAPATMSFTLAAGGDGRLRAIEASAVLGMGSDGWTFPTLEPAKSVYACENARLMTLPVKQNLGPSAAFRAPGVMEGTWGFEQAMDELAARIGLDPLELRRRNHADTDQSSGRPYSSKRLLDCYERAAELAGWSERDDLLGDGRVRRGMGLATQIWWGGGGPPAYAEVRIGRDAQPVVTVGVQDLGTGTLTACAMVAAERLGVPVDAVRVLAGDTDRSGHGPLSGGSMTLASVAPAVRAAGHAVRTQLLDLASDMFEIAASDLLLVDGEVRSVDGTMHHAITDVTGKLGNAWVRGEGSRGPNPDGVAVNTFGCQVAQVAVDTAAGAVTVERVVAVHDVGRVVNPMGARSQVVGGILQGLGFALMEERVVDPTTGTVLNPGLEDYAIPTIADLPDIVCEFVGTPDPKLPMGIKGLAEPPIIPTAAAIGNAIAHALGVRIREAPYTPRRVLEALQT